MCGVKPRLVELNPPPYFMWEEAEFTLAGAKLKNTTKLCAFAWEFEEWLREDIANKYWRDLQRQLQPFKGFTDRDLEFYRRGQCVNPRRSSSLVGNNHQFFQLCRKEGEGVDDVSHRLDEMFLLVGTSERMEEFMVAFEKLTGIPIVNEYVNAAKDGFTKYKVYHFSLKSDE